MMKNYKSSLKKHGTRTLPLFATAVGGLIALFSSASFAIAPLSTSYTLTSNQCGFGERCFSLNTAADYNTIRNATVRSHPRYTDRSFGRSIMDCSRGFLDSESGFANSRISRITIMHECTSSTIRFRPVYHRAIIERTVVCPANSSPDAIHSTCIDNGPIEPVANYTIGYSSILTDIQADTAGVKTILQTTVTNPDSVTLEFSATNLPVWADLDPSTGVLTTKPNQPTLQNVSGNPYAGVVVKVKDVSNNLWKSIGPFVFNVIGAMNTAPTAVITPPADIEVGDQAYFSADLSVDADGNMLTYRWVFTESNGNVIEYPASANNIYVAPIFTVPGNVTALLIVNDGTGNANSSGSTQLNVFVDRD